MNEDMGQRNKLMNGQTNKRTNEQMDKGTNLKQTNRNCNFDFCRPAVERQMVRRKVLQM